MQLDTSAPTRRPSAWVLGVLLFALLMIVYMANGTVQFGNDATSNVHLPLQVLEHRSVFFTPEQNPHMFTYQFRTPTGAKYGRIRDWNAAYEGGTLLSALRRGDLTFVDSYYYLVPTQHSGKYANTFGLGAGLVALPVFAAVKPFVPSLEQRIGIQWQLGKIAAAAAVAGSAVFLFLAALARLPWLAAFLLALAYGTGTCVWSTSSQALWQHGPCELFLAMGAYFLLRKERRYADTLCGLSLGLAVFCRPTMVLVVLSTILFHALTDRRRLLRFMVGGLPVAVVVLAYSWYAFGNPLAFGQLAGSGIAQAKTGNPDLWQTPLYLGAAGLLLSPGRGLLVYSPIAIFAFWGMVRMFRDPEWKDLRPLALGAVALFLLSCKWFDWWGGWCFGYRPIVDISVLLAFASLPIVDRVRSARFLQAGFAVLLCWSVIVQVIGAIAYDVEGWNGRNVFDVTLPGTGERITFDDKESAVRQVRDRGGRVESRSLNIDAPENRKRLWSVTDSPIFYYLGNFSAASENRKKRMEEFLRIDG
jgi:hypothetical protein